MKISEAIKVSFFKLSLAEDFSENRRFFCDFTLSDSILSEFSQTAL
jgi:hypothetical protein